MSKKPYIYESLEGWLQITKKKSWNDPSVNPNDLAPYSEFQRPYINDKDMSYPEWEWSFPDDDPPPPWILPDPIFNPCNINEDCVWAGIIGPDQMECEQCFTWSQAHLWLGCTSAPWWAAYGEWKIVEENFVTGDCYFLFSGPVMATVCCDEETVGKFSIRYEGVLDCVGEVEVKVTCGCCKPFTLTGDATVNPGEDWVGIIDPPCPGSTCTMGFNADDPSECEAGCVVSGSGGSVTVSVGENDCGVATVTVTDTCKENSASATIRINNTGQGGSWVPYCNYNTVFCPTAGCTLNMEKYSGKWKIVCRCGSMGGDCKGDYWPFTCQGDDLTACDCDCDGHNQITAYIWECPDCEP